MTRPVGLPRSASGWTMAVFGVLAAALGTVGLVSPAAQLSMLGLATPGERGSGDHTSAFVTASSMAAVNMGVYYVLAALADWRAFFRWTVPFRLLTCTVFTVAVIGGRAPEAFIGVGVWEGLGAVATGVALLHERRATTKAARSRVRTETT
ncbi:uncharacterized membrane protein HdeD (DUF308 family) [Streptomyces albaduncus]|uniref:Uncharacterized membrane protein HdeD (DUF308 family) n=2 Tax=Streptomyces griseoloalbus TaxID=67303 RepID=A0A7W8BS93_9ACTN|nr:uncharacterized membrane protein HdeD (DUF308 family) [Streptomyces albaduncus]GGW46938.1 hypothetical protein GCM10010340_26350 [Streptomyces albaduncus]